MIQTNFSEANSNFSSWLDAAGLNNIPDWVLSSNFDTYGTIFTVIVFLCALFWPQLTAIFLKSELIYSAKISIKTGGGGKFLTTRSLSDGSIMQIMAIAVTNNTKMPISDNTLSVINKAANIENIRSDRFTLSSLETKYIDVAGSDGKRLWLLGSEGAGFGESGNNLSIDEKHTIILKLKNNNNIIETLARVYLEDKQLKIEVWE